MDATIAVPVWYFVVAWLACWAVDLLGVEPFASRILKAVVVLVCLIIVLWRLAHHGWLLGAIRGRWVFLYQGALTLQVFPFKLSRRGRIIVRYAGEWLIFARQGEFIGKEAGADHRQAGAADSQASRSYPLTQFWRAACLLPGRRARWQDRRHHSPLYIARLAGTVAPCGASVSW